MFFRYLPPSTSEACEPSPNNPLHTFLPRQSVTAGWYPWTSHFSAKLSERQKRQWDTLSTSSFPAPLWTCVPGLEQRGGWLVASSTLNPRYSFWDRGRRCPTAEEPPCVRALPDPHIARWCSYWEETRTDTEDWRKGLPACFVGQTATAGPFATSALLRTLYLLRLVCWENHTWFMCPYTYFSFHAPFLRLFLEKDDKVKWNFLLPNLFSVPFSLPYLELHCNLSSGWWFERRSNLVKLMDIFTYQFLTGSRTKR